MILRDLGEFKLIKRLSNSIRPSKEVIKGIGDDAGVLRYKKDRHLLFTSDMLLEGRHFYKKEGAYLIGKKALCSNISDIAAMGGVPKCFLVSLGAPASLKVGFIDKLYKGLRDTARKFNIDLAGGDTIQSDKIIINIALLGEVKKKDLVLRSGAKNGDSVFVTGTIGSLSKTKHLDFIPRLKEAQFLVKWFKINSMIDVSDGLLADLGHILSSSEVSSLIYETKVPLSKGVTDFSLAVNKGEDFELVFTMAKNEGDRLIKKWPFKTRLSRIGEISDSRKSYLINKYGKRKPLEMKGYSHF